MILFIIFLNAQYHAALREPSNFKEAISPVDVWRFATMVSGGWCVQTPGVKKMLELPVDSWDYQVLVSFTLLV